MSTPLKTLSALEAVRCWRDFASVLKVQAPNGRSITWTEYLTRYPNGRGDERTMVGPVAFPQFAEQVLGFEVGRTLAAEVTGPEGRPDFTPADALTHPFVFEVKGTDGKVSLSGHEAQVGRYLREGRPRIHRVALTNLVGLRVFELDADGLQVKCSLEISLRALATVPQEHHAAALPDARRLADFINLHRFQALSQAQKIDRVRKSPAWNPEFEITSTDWVLTRLDSVVEALTSNVTEQVKAGALADPTQLPPGDRPVLVHELHEPDKRVGSSDAEAAKRTLKDYLAASPKTKPNLALEQLMAHTAFYTATRLLLVRAWEDGGLLNPAALYNGGFDNLMAPLANVTEVVQIAYKRAGDRYPELFGRHNAFSWYTPSEDVYINAIYDLANTYLGNLSDDILGEVYQRQLARVDRKQLGQYYTPRDVIKLIWDLIGSDDLADTAADQDRPFRVLDIATGSGGFLVEGAARERRRFEAGRLAGESLATRDWLDEVTDGFVGCEVQQFSAYLAEVNLVLQFSPLLAGEAHLRLPGMRVHCADTLTLHNPDTLSSGSAADEQPADQSGIEDLEDARSRQDSLEKLRNPHVSGQWLDVACGNPPYVGEKSIAKTMESLRQHHPYWRQFSAAHQDYLYNFLILGISKLRRGGRFGFITTEYWLKAAGAAPLRAYLAKHTRIDRLVLFRQMTLFPDAPGQHNLIVVGQRVTDPEDPSVRDGTGRPLISVYDGPARPSSRATTLAAIAAGRNAPATTFISSFRSTHDPSALEGASWAELAMTRKQIGRRKAVRRYTDKAVLVMSEGVIATPQTLRARHAEHLSAKTLTELGGPDSRAGIFELTGEERTALERDSGGLTQTEQDHLRRVINTADVYPYAAVVPDDAHSLVYLPASDGGPNGKFPADMPTIEQHLERFKPLLEDTVRGYGRGRLYRPWWSAHNPRAHLVAADPDVRGWADFAVTARWGDRKLLTGLAPARTLPLSGLHALTGGTTTNAAYLVGLINSTPVQELAEALAPGSVGQDDFASLGLPQFDVTTTRAIEKSVRNLADLVRRLVTIRSRTWPELPAVLRADLTLTSPVMGAWLPTAHRRGWGTIGSVTWLTVEGDGPLSGVVEQANVVDDELFGRRLDVHCSKGTRRIRVAAGPDHDTEGQLYDVLNRVVGGLAATRGSATGLSAASIPVDPQALLATYAKDEVTLAADVQSYQQNRAAIDQLVLTGLAS